MLGGASWVIPRNTRYPEAAAATLRSLMDIDVQRELELKGGWPFPGLRELYHDARTIKKHPYYTEAEGLLRHGKLLEELPYMAGNPQTWLDLGSQEVSALLRPVEKERWAVQQGRSFRSTSLEGRTEPYRPTRLTRGV